MSNSRSGRKRPQSPNPGPSTLPAKRRRAGADVAPLDRYLSEELLLKILFYLSASDLASVSRLSRCWHRLANDPQLWKRLFHSQFAPSRLRASFRPLPAEIQRFGAVEGDVASVTGHSWKALYRISSNWRSGRARAATVVSSTLRANVLDGRLPKNPGERSDEDQDSVGHETSLDPSGSGLGADTIVQFRGSLLFTASRTARSGGGTVNVYSTRTRGQEPALVGQIPYCRASSQCTVGVAEMRLDDNLSVSPSARLAVFYTSGSFSVFSIALDTFEQSEGTLAYAELYTSAAPTHDSRPAPRTDVVALARFHFPLLVTCSMDFSLTFHILRPTPGGGSRLDARHAEPRMRSQICWWPLVLSLAPLAPDPAPKSDKGDRLHYKATIAYATPFFPSAWTVAVQDFTITIDPLSSAAPAQIATRVATALPPGFTTSPSRRARHRAAANASARWPVPHQLITGLEHAEPFVVAARADNTIDCFEIFEEKIEGTKGPSKLSIVHRKTLFGHTGSVGAVAIDGGRCVSGGEDGVKVWELDRRRRRLEHRGGITGDEAVSVWNADDHSVAGQGDEGGTSGRSWLSLACHGPAAKMDSTVPRRVSSGASGVTWVGFDEDKIVSVEGPSPWTRRYRGVDGLEGSRSDETIRVFSFD